MWNKLRILVDGEVTEPYRNTKLKCMVQQNLWPTKTFDKQQQIYAK